MNDCFFCGPTKNPLTEEHVWPQWVSRLLLGKYESTHFINIRSTEKKTTGYRKSRLIDVSTKTVCDKCNNVWLSQFENTEIKPIASPLIRGEDSVVLSPNDQWKLAAWAYKMAILLEVSIPPGERPPLFFYPEDRRQFRDTTTADEHVRIFVSKYQYGQRPGHAQLREHNFTERENKNRSFDLRVSTMTAGQLGMQVIAVRSVLSAELVYASEIEFNLLGKAKNAIVRVWPPNSEAVRWPPRATMTQQDIEDWTEMWSKPEQPG